MKKYEFKNGDVLHHYKKSLVLCFQGNRKVLSTGPNNGGYRTDLQAVFNYDANPGPGMGIQLNAPSYREHMDLFAEKDLGLNPHKVTGLMTAASMENASIRTLTYEDFSVTAVVTGGVKGNGGRAGDPANWHGREDKASNAETEEVTPEKTNQSEPRIGTINILLHIDADLDPGTLARTIVTCTEAKTAVLQELMVPSRYSTGPATGTGTDGVIVVADADSPVYLTNAGKHSKLGELIGRTVKEALREALQKQQGLNPEKQHDILNRIDRYGVTEDTLWEDYKEWIERNGHEPERTEEFLQKTKFPFLRAEFTEQLEKIRKNAMMVTYTSLFVHLLDQLNWGLISGEEAENAGDVLLEQIEIIGESLYNKELRNNREISYGRDWHEQMYADNKTGRDQNMKNTENLLLKKYKTCIVSLVHHNIFVV